MIVFGIRFALFCYLPIHSITLSFVAIFILTPQTIMTMRRTIYTHILLLYAHTADIQKWTRKRRKMNEQTSEPKKEVTYCVWIRLTYFARVAVSHNKRERWKLNKRNTIN